MKKQITLSALAMATALTATSAFAGVTVGESHGGKLKLSGKAFINFATEDDAGTTTTGGAVDRFYFQAKYIKDDWYARITTDVNNEQGRTGSSTTPGLKRNMNVFLKYAYVEREFNDAAQVRLGLSHTPWIDYEQGLWGHRYAAKVTSDHFGFDTSSDYGIALKGKLADKMVQYWVTATNGGGYGNPNPTGAMDFNSRITVKPMDGLDVSLQYFSGYKGKKTDSTVNIADKDSMIQFMVAYKTDDYAVGANIIDVKNLKTKSNDDRSANAIWATAKFNSDFGAFARFDQSKADLTNITEDRTVVGLDYFMDKGMTVSLVYTNLTDDKAISAKDVTTYGIYSLVKF